MTHDVFLSYSSKDKKAADAACAVLERHGIRVWIAPRDILPGAKWGASIIGAINGARVMVLVFSGNANSSQHIENEVERTINRGIPIVPFRIENVKPSQSLELFISASHWLDAYTPPFAQHLDRLATVVLSLLNGETPPPPPPNPTRNKLYMALLALIAVAAVGFGANFLVSGAGTAPPAEISPAPQISQAPPPTAVSASTVTMKPPATPAAPPEPIKNAVVAEAPSAPICVRCIRIYPSPLINPERSVWAAQKLSASLRASGFATDAAAGAPALAVEVIFQDTTAPAFDPKTSRMFSTARIQTRTRSETDGSELPALSATVTGAAGGEEQAAYEAIGVIARKFSDHLSR